MIRVFNMTPASNGVLIFVAAFTLLMLAFVVFFGWTAYSSKNTRFEVTDQGLKISSVMYGRFIPKEDLVTDKLEIVNMNLQKDYKLNVRTNGIGLPGFDAGWFKLKNKEKALVFVTDPTSVVYIPTTKGYSVLLSVRNVEEFRYAARSWL